MKTYRYMIGMLLCVWLLAACDNLMIWIVRLCWKMLHIMMGISVFK